MKSIQRYGPYGDKEDMGQLCDYHDYLKEKARADDFTALACRIAQAADAHLYGVPDQYTGEALKKACDELRARIARDSNGPSLSKGEIWGG